MPGRHVARRVTPAKTVPTVRQAKKAPKDRKVPKAYQASKGDKGDQGDRGPPGPIAGNDTQLSFNNSPSADGANVYYIVGNGHLGVGVPVPSERLHVSGNGLVTGNINGGGTICDGTDTCIGQVADNAVTSEKILDGEVNTVDLANGAVTEPKLADESVGEEKLKDNSVSSSKLKDNSVATLKIARSRSQRGQAARWQRGNGQT